MKTAFFFFVFFLLVHIRCYSQLPVCSGDTAVWVAVEYLHPKATLVDKGKPGYVPSIYDSLFSKIFSTAGIHSASPVYTQTFFKGIWHVPADGQNTRIIYCIEYLDSIIKSAKNDTDCVLPILAHELGHHILRHVAPFNNSLSRHSKEFQADFYAGYLMRLMHVPFCKVKLGYQAGAIREETENHPSYLQRIETVMAGWQFASISVLKDPTFMNTLPIAPVLFAPASEVTKDTNDLSGDILIELPQQIRYRLDNIGNIFIDSANHVFDSTGKRIGNRVYKQGRSYKFKLLVGDETFYADFNENIWTDKPRKTQKLIGKKIQ